MRAGEPEPVVDLGAGGFAAIWWKMTLRCECRSRKSWLRFVPVWTMEYPSDTFAKTHKGKGVYCSGGHSAGLRGCGVV